MRDPTSSQESTSGFVVQAGPLSLLALLTKNGRSQTKKEKEKIKMNAILAAAVIFVVFAALSGIVWQVFLKKGGEKA